MKIYLCGNDESLQDALRNVNESDPDGKTYVLDEEKDRCYIGDERFAKAPVIINFHNTYYAPRQEKPTDS